MSDQKPQMVRQGDVLLVPIEPSELPPGASVQPRDPHGRIILAEGEATGHAHAILDADVELLGIADQVDRWLRVGVQATLQHEEHGYIQLAPGAYRIIRQREYTPTEIRRVAD